MFFEPPESILNIDLFFDGKLSFPLTLEEYKKYLWVHQQPTQLLDFCFRVKEYEEMYHDWKQYRKRVDKLEKRKKKKKLEEEPDQELEVEEEEDLEEIKVMGDRTPEMFPMSKQPSMEFPQPKKSESQENLILKKQNTDLLNVIHPTSKNVGKKAYLLFKKDFQHSEFIKTVPKEIYEPIVKHYTEAMKTSEKTGLRFIPSPDRAFVPILKYLKKEFQKSHYRDFIHFSTKQKIPTIQNQRYSYQLLNLYKPYAIVILYALICAILLMLIYLTKLPKYGIFLILPPVVMMVWTCLLSYYDMDSFLWMQKRKEIFDNSCFGGLSSDTTIEKTIIDEEEVEEEVDVNDFSEELKEEKMVELVVRTEQIKEPLLLLIQNQIYFKLFFYSLLCGILLPGLLLFIWPT